MHKTDEVAKRYEAPSISTLGTVEELTLQNLPAKCGGSGDSLLPQVLSKVISTNCP